MSSTTTRWEFPLQSLPLAHSPIAGVERANQSLLRHVANWNQWLVEQGGEHANQLMLYTTIRDTIARRRPGGAWADVDKKVIPEVATIFEKLDLPKYRAYEDAVESKLRAKENAALELIRTYLEPPQCRQYMGRMDYVERLRLANDLATGLMQTECGKAYIHQCLTDPTSEGHGAPLFHQDSIFGFPVPPGTPVNLLAETYTWSTTAAPILIEFFLKVKATVYGDPETMVGLTAKVLGAYFPGLYPMPPVVPPDLARGTDQIKQWLQETQEAENLAHNRVFSGLALAIELVNLWVMLQDVAQGKSVDKLKLMRTVTAVVAAVDAAQAFYPDVGLRFASPQARKVFSTGLGGAVAILDMTLAAMGAYNAYKDKDYSVVAGNAAQFVGGGMALAATIFAATAWAGPVAVAAAAVGLVGAIVITATAETSMELWIEYNFFGSEWHDVDVVVAPDSRYFLFRCYDGKPNFPRQISAFISLLQPVPLTVEAKSARFGSDTNYYMEIQAPANSGLEGTRLLVKQALHEQIPGEAQPRCRVRPIMEIEFDSFTSRDGGRVKSLGHRELTSGIQHYGSFGDWTLEIDVVAKEHPGLDWNSYYKIDKDDPNYLAPYLTVRRVRKEG